MKERKAAAVFVISVAAEMAGMHPQTLRIYERRGLVEPYRTPGGTRRYSQADVDRLTLINELTAAGLNLEGVLPARSRAALDDPSPGPEQEKMTGRKAPSSAS
jgi:DNA-binding transcriptional MerR regulator